LALEGILLCRHQQNALFERLLSYHQHFNFSCNSNVSKKLTHSLRLQSFLQPTLMANRNQICLYCLKSPASNVSNFSRKLAYN